ncbi:RNA polymerase sigma factor [Patescibacteria group bacterium]|nr:MAG: RNA polymerase sigma factor [Patescibacteria group bacterium]
MSDPLLESDSTLLMRAAAGDAEAFAMLYDRYAIPVYRHMLFRSGDHETAQDVTSQAFLRTWEHLRTGNTIRAFRAFLYRTAQNAFVDSTRRRASSDLSLEELCEDGRWEVASGEDLAAATEIREHASLLRRALSSLPEHHRLVLTLRYFDELSISEISRITGKNAGTVYVSLHRGVRALRQALVEADSPRHIPGI